MKKNFRSVAREAAFKALFQLEFNDGEETEREFYENLAVETATEESEKLSQKNLLYVSVAVTGTRAHLQEIDEIIKSYLKKNWSLARIATADRNILRLAVYEMKFAEDKNPSAVIINEAVELAKKYGTDESGRFVNGILDAISK